jgi:hypothetical protein
VQWTLDTMTKKMVLGCIAQPLTNIRFNSLNSKLVEVKVSSLSQRYFGFSFAKYDDGHVPIVSLNGRCVSLVLD